MRKTVVVLPMALMVAGLLASCGKSVRRGSSSGCEITDIASVGPDTTQKITYKIYYDNQGRVDSIRGKYANGSYILKTFDRVGNSVVMHTTTATYQQTDSIVINGAGLMMQDLQTNTFGSTSLFECIYSGTEVTEGISLIPAGDTTFYPWQNGDMTAIAKLSTFFGYNDKASMAGDYWHLVNLINTGAPSIVTAHQVNLIYLLQGSPTMTPQTINIAYTYDGDGKITTLTYSGDLSQTVSYQYSCH